MKKVFSLFIVLCAVTNISFCQHNWGAATGYARIKRGAIKEANFIGSPVADIFYRHQIFPKCYVKGAMGFITTGYKLKNLGFSTYDGGYVKETINYLRFTLTPFYYRKAINKNTAVTAGVGIYFAYGINGFYKVYQGTLTKNKTDFGSTRNRIDIGGMNAEISVELKEHFFIQGFLMRGTPVVSRAQYNTNTGFGLSVGYLF
jgi:hypothetical protein